MNTTPERFKRSLTIGRMADNTRLDVEVDWDGRKLSLTGTLVEGVREVGWGQTIDALGELTQLATGWTPEMVTRLHDTWTRWHLNDMRPGCEHQRAEGWDKRPIDPSKPLDTYGKHFPGQRSDSWNMLTWIIREEHPEGLLSVPCPTCGYKYGSAWLHEEVPQDVLDWLYGLPARPGRQTYTPVEES